MPINFDYQRQSSFGQPHPDFDSSGTYNRPNNFNRQPNYDIRGLPPPGFNRDSYYGQPPNHDGYNYGPYPNDPRGRKNPQALHNNMTEDEKRALAIAKITALNAGHDQETSEHVPSESSYYDSEEEKTDKPNQEG